MVADGDLNFRVRGIPNAYENKSGVRKLIMEVLSIQPGTSVSVRSLAASPIDANTRVATVVFHRLPTPISDRDKDEWSFSLPVREDVDEDDIDWPLPIIFDTHFIGFTPLDHASQSESHVDVIAISGLGGHAFGSFKDRDGPFMWLRDALPLDFPGSRILVYGYNTRLHQSHSFQNLIDLSRALLGDLQGLRGRDHDHPTVFIGHSLGGLVIKEAVVNDQNVLTLEGVLGFVFFGVPHLGMATRSLVPLVNNQPNRCLVESLNKNSAFLQHLDNDFNKMISGKGPKVVSFYETEESPTAARNHNGEWRLSGPAEILVDVSSATCGPQHSYPIDRNHSEMVKFRNHYDEFYIRVRSVLQPLLVRRNVTNAFIYTEASIASTRTPDAQYQCLRSLSFQEQESRHINILCAKDTCGWILEDPQYRAWMRSSSGLFWVKGNPGAGKSVLMKFACQTMSMQQRKEDGLVVSFFVHGQGNTLQKTPFGMFRALLNSLLLKFPEPLSRLTERFEDRERRYGSYEQGRWKWEENELRDFLSDLLIQRTGALPVTIFVDALDECGESQAKTLLAYFKTVVQTAELENGQVRVCVSSRHYPILGRKSIPTISVEERNHRDIRLYVQQSLREIEPGSERHSIESEILLKAQGGFQWVVLVTTKVLEGSTRGIRADHLHEYLKSIPEDLDELYANLVYTATGVEECEMAKLFLWILCATRPLSAHELREALASDKDMEHTTTFDLRRHRSWISNIAQFEVYIQHISRGLVEFQTRDVWEKYDVDGGYDEEWDREAQFVHQSVADFLLKSFPQCSELAPYSSWTTTGLGNFEISRSCLKYLMLQDVLQGAQLPRVAYCTRFPLLQYAVSSVFDHIWQLDEEGIPQTDLLNLFGWDEDAKSFTKIASVWKVLDPDGGHAPAGWPFTGATPLHALAAFGVKSAFDSYLDENVLVDSVDSDGNTPFLLAIWHRKQDMALALLDRSIEWEQRLELADCPLTVQAEIQRRASYQVNFKAENYEGDTALTIALDQDADKVVLKLLDMKDHFDISGLDVELVTCAVRGRNPDLLKKLIGMNISLDGVIYFAVHELSWAGDDEFLDATIYNCLKAGANILKSAEFGLTAERQRSTESEPSTDSSRSEDLEDEFDDALSLAILKGCANTVRCLLSHGVSASVRTQEGRPPLLFAASHGHATIVQMLLNTGQVNPNTKDPFGRSALSVAAWFGHAAVAQALLDTGEIDPDTKDEVAGSPLSYAAEYGHMTVVQMLLDTGQVKADATDVYGRSPLSYAAEYGHMTVIQMLLDTGQVKADATDVYGRTPLSYAAQQGFELMVRLLWEKERVDLNLRDKAGRSPLSYAAERGNAARFVEVGQHTRMIDIPSTDLWSCPPFWYLTQDKVSAIVNQPSEEPFGHLHRVGLALDFYGRDSPVSTISVAVFTARGYTVIFTFSCGTFGSDGIFVPGMCEQADSYGVVAWVRRQRWFPGRFDAFGSSYLVYTQWGLLRNPPPYLACSTVLGAPNDHTVFNWTGEAYRLNRLRWSNATPSPREKPPRAGRRP
ncbi:uncharacterized protein E0L32_004063 [Thyridium curvatum]|uniref:NACHT domain-containing protein n=1 Tax=Thyridium curvatum TaxID=1093900 RepID=A0A507BH60_9PEZI|nr:uncharacterized protein E0L32_004063 [Thyridium curvatum]TPX16068.1 hypothetical protein E0L32_004063 [Thyridium curvatum]